MPWTRLKEEGAVIAKRESRRVYAWLPVFLVVMVAVALAIGGLTLNYVERYLVAMAGESLALAAADIADKLDRILYERYGDIQVLAQTPLMQGGDPATRSSYLGAMKAASHYYLWLGVTDANGRIVAATDPAGLDKDRSDTQWFRAARDGGGIDVQDVHASEESGGVLAVAFTAPLTGSRGEFRGVVTTRVGISDLEDVIAGTVRALQVQRGTSARIEYQFMTRDGELIADSVLHQDGGVNLKLLALPSALLSASAQPGYVEERHARRHLPVVTGYAGTEGYGKFTGLHWGVLVRMDRHTILDPIRTFLWKLGAAAALVFVPMLGFLLWATERLKKEWALEQEEAARAVAAEAAVRESEERIRLIINAALDAVIVMDSGGLIIDWNPMAERIFGWSREEAIGRLMSEKIIPLRYRAAHTQGVKRFLTTGEGPVLNKRIEITALHRDGREFPVELTVSPVRSGDTFTFSAFVRDITERKGSEAALRQSEERLRQSQKMEAIGQLAGGIAHDFNNLLTAIIGYSGLLLSRLSPENQEWKNAEQIQKAADRAASLTRQLLAFSRRQILTMKRLNLNAVVMNLEPMLRRLIGEEIALKIVPSPALGQVQADPGQIDQIIMNLAVNARDAMPHGGQLTIETAHVELDELYARRRFDVRPGPHVLLAVSDTGYGMNAETQARIFEPFFTTKEQGKGTGLGLSTVYGIVKQSGGHIFVYSEVGRGTSFKIYLPRIEDAEGPITPEAGAAAQPRGTETVLLVEDEEGVRTLIHSVLEGHGYTVLVARHSEEAFRVCGRHDGAIHLLITDVVMPGMSGRELAERLASAHPKMKVLYMSGYTDDAVVRHGVLAEGTAFLQKPFTPEVLLGKVRDVLDASTK